MITSYLGNRYPLARSVLVNGELKSLRLNRWLKLAARVAKTVGLMPWRRSHCRHSRGRPFLCPPGLTMFQHRSAENCRIHL
ncbi:hypothetical protein SIN8267_01354 [Sinobacterium norvegicum]|uniref:Uncharacterized protein n=1 Tax=Sinobacterium norvegicum TaxID=1641715 RepID=A0ABN8EK91_9GAMM|nr:hypothetical protein SIN8267_01354 [Sinobacterium norvegicum]